MTTVLEYAIWMLRQGYLRIDDEGRIWRTAAKIHGEWKPIRSQRASGAKLSDLSIQFNLSVSHIHRICGVRKEA